MRRLNFWRRIVEGTTLFSVSLPFFVTSSAIADNLSTQNYSNTAQQDSTELTPGPQVAQEPGACYRITAEEAEEGMYVREEPTIYSEAIAILDYGQAVTVLPNRNEHYVPISSPIRGYIFGGWLAPC